MLVMPYRLTILCMGCMVGSGSDVSVSATRRFYDIEASSSLSAVMTFSIFRPRPRKLAGGDACQTHCEYIYASFLPR